MTATFRDPRVQPQLNNGSSTGGSDCMFRQCEAAITWANGGALQTPTIGQMRKYIGVPSGGIDLLAAQQIVRHYAPSAGAAFTRTPDTIWAALAAGAFVIAATDYGWVNANAPHLSGDHGFDENHADGLFGVEKIGRRTYTEWHDSLLDARRSAIPKSNAMARRREVDGAMAALTHGTQALVVTRGGI